MRKRYPALAFRVINLFIFPLILLPYEWSVGDDFCKTFFFFCSLPVARLNSDRKMCSVFAITNHEARHGPLKMRDFEKRFSRFWYETVTSHFSLVGIRLLSCNWSNSIQPVAPRLFLSAYYLKSSQLSPGLTLFPYRPLIFPNVREGLKDISLSLVHYF